MQHREGQHNRMFELLELVANRGLNGDEAVELRTMLIADAGARELYALYMLMHADLTWEHAESERVQGSGFRVQADGQRGQFAIRHPQFAIAAVAAVVALAVTAWFQFTASPQPSPPGRSAQPPRTVAMLTNVNNAVFADPSQPMRLGGELPSGSIRLTAGRAQIMFQSGATVDMSGPCDFELTDANRGRLTVGTLHVQVPESARGFTIDLANGARIVDLGTAFSVRALPDRSVQVRVSEGRIEVHDNTGQATSADAGERIALDSAGRRIRTQFAGPTLPRWGDMRLWLRADQARGQGADRFVTRWPDRSDRWAMVHVDGAPPTRQVADDEGFAFVRFTGEARLAALDLLNDRTVGDFTILCVYRMNLEPKPRHPDHYRGLGFGRLADLSASRDNTHMNLAADGTLRFDGSYIGQGYRLKHPDTWFIRTTRRAGDTFSEYYNGQLALPPTAHSGVQPVDDFYLGALLKPIPEDQPFDLAEVIVYSTALTDAQRQTIERQLAERYGLAPPPPPDSDPSDPTQHSSTTKENP